MMDGILIRTIRIENIWELDFIIKFKKDLLMEADLSQLKQIVNPIKITLHGMNMLISNWLVLWYDLIWLVERREAVKGGQGSRWHAPWSNLISASFLPTRILLHPLGHQFLHQLNILHNFSRNLNYTFYYYKVHLTTVK